MDRHEQDFLRARGACRAPRVLKKLKASIIGVVMINNTSFGKWNRLRQKNLNQRFMNEVINGLNCSPFEASAVLDTVYNVYSTYFDGCPSLKQG